MDDKAELSGKTKLKHVESLTFKVPKHHVLQGIATKLYLTETIFSKIKWRYMLYGGILVSAPDSQS